MSYFLTMTHIEAAPEQVWKVMTDVERWPEWTRSIKSIEALDGGAPRVGARFRIRQPDLPPATWKVTAWNENRGFTWVSENFGVTVSAEHIIEPTARGCRVVLALDYSGYFGSVAAYLASNLTCKYLEMEAAGLKAQCEGVPTALAFC